LNLESFAEKFARHAVCKIALIIDYDKEKFNQISEDMLLF
jgi:hypothetical protein